MTRARDNADGARLDAPLAGPTFTGTVAIPNVANLETAVVANTAKVTNYNQTLADINALDVTELGTVTSANLANTAIVYQAGHIVQYVMAAVTTTGSGTIASLAVGAFGNTATISSPADNNKILIIGCGGQLIAAINGTNYDSRVGIRVTQTGASGSPNDIWGGDIESGHLPANIYNSYPATVMVEYESDGTNDIVAQLITGGYDSKSGIWAANANFPVWLMAQEIQV